ncbi:MAG: diacylglycerol/lipid kinase family protein [Actinomycetota bacterium]
MAEIVIVANPTSGRGKGRRLLEQLKAALRASAFDHEIVVSENPEHPERAAREAAEAGVRILLAVGGDGLVSSCANGLVGTDTALGIIPAGSGNDFAQCVGLDTKRPLNALALLAEPRIRRVDAVRAEGPGWARHFVCVSGCGFDSETNEYANTLTHLRGRAPYVVAVFRTLIRFQPAEFRLTVDGEEHRREAMLVAVGNTQSYGGGMRICPNAEMDDGLLDVTVVGSVSKPTFVRVFPRVFSGSHIDHPSVSTHRGAKVELEALAPFRVYADGEDFGPLPATFTALPGTLGVVSP